MAVQLNHTEVCACSVYTLQADRFVKTLVLNKCLATERKLTLYIYKT